MRVLLVDDDPRLRALLRATFEVADVEIDEAAGALAALRAVAEAPPDVVVLDIGMPGVDGLTLCRRLKSRPETRSIPVVLLTGIEGPTLGDAKAAGAEAFVRKPFSPLELLSVVDRLAGGVDGVPSRAARNEDPDEQLLLYARDLRHLLELERGQRLVVESAYEQTVTVLASALESKDTGTRAHSQRVQRYAIELASALAPRLSEDESVQYGFLLHDVGKIGIPDRILRKPKPLSDPEERLMRTHTVLGAQMLAGVSLLQGEGLNVVRHHHERWDGLGYPDALARADIPVGARIFAVADALDAMTSDRPYRRARSWAFAREEVLRGSKRQFDPDVVDAFRERELALRAIARELAAT